MARLLALALVVLGGCSVVLNGDEHTDSPPPDMGGVDLGPQPLEPSDACNRFADVLCEAAFDCCSTPPSECAGDREACINTCKRDYQVSCLQTLGGFVADPAANYDADVAGEVLWEAQRRAASCDTSLAEVFAIDLLEIPQGTLDAGDPACDPVEGLGMIDIVKAKYCGGGLECLSTGGALGTWECGEPRGADEPCTTFLECEDGLGCGPTMTCGPREANGGPCFLAGDCESFVCERTVGDINGECVAATEANVYCAFFDAPMR